ncbi:putative glutathione S-transferase [Cinnamomum micranthum f. kanehirae]|uniref:Putative glutathione S-transferase n=1 Tax=Cinnamomum micranthum f. kanehirae TaxID=337451 RepID=A0A443NI19_9MAGN|nr:putative glutathione S-transferase [Cinnamomum micranthum f. kanehirae]
MEKRLNGEKEVRDIKRRLDGEKRERHLFNETFQDETVKKEFIDCLKPLEGELKDKSFYGSKSLWYVDVVLVLFDCWFYAYESDVNFSIENEHPKLIVLVERCMEKESVSKVLLNAHKIYDFVGDLKKKCGVEFW